MSLLDEIEKNRLEGRVKIFNEGLERSPQFRELTRSVRSLGEGLETILGRLDKAEKMLELLVLASGEPPGFFKRLRGFFRG